MLHQIVLATVMFIKLFINYHWPLTTLSQQWVWLSICICVVEEQIQRHTVVWSCTPLKISDKRSYKHSQLAEPWLTASYAGNIASKKRSIKARTKVADCKQHKQSRAILMLLFIWYSEENGLCEFQYLCCTLYKNMFWLFTHLMRSVFDTVEILNPFPI